MDETGGLQPHEPGPDEVVYELDDWDEIRWATLGELLDDEGVAYRWDSARLVVAEGDADLVEELIDDLDHPDALEAEDDDGDDDGAEILSSLYVAADVLCATPGHAQAAEELLASAQAAGEGTVPYGLDPAVWTELGAMAERLAGCLREGAGEEVIEAARLLRQALHPLV